MNINMDTDIVIVGGGPVGLLLGLLLDRMRIPSVILEMRDRPMEHSRSIGIHPPSMEIFQNLDLAGEFMDAGVQVRRGHAFLDRNPIGTLSFEACPEPFNFILTLPQFRTETILEDHARKAPHIRFIRNARVTQVHAGQNDCEISYYNESTSKASTIRCKLAVGCDGKNSFVRNQLNIGFKGSHYPDTYVMADIADDTRWGSDAAVILHREGVIESFPLPDALRRWVIKTPQLIQDPQPEAIRDLIGARFGFYPKMERLQMISSFGVQKFLARHFKYKRVLLAGDAAHVVSPIGGQGMNLGWLDANSASIAIQRWLQEGDERHLHAYERDQKKQVLISMRRAGFNMWLGRKRVGLPLSARNLLVRTFLKKPLSHGMARRFTMRDRNRILL